MMLSNMAIILGLHTNLFRVTQSLESIFQVISEVAALILNKNPTEIFPDKKLAKLAAKNYFLLKISTRIQTTPLFWYLRSVIQKVR